MNPVSGEVFSGLHEALLSRLAHCGDADDRSVRHEIRELMESSGTARTYSVRDRRKLEEALFRSVRRLDILQQHNF